MITRRFTVGISIVVLTEVRMVITSKIAQNVMIRSNRVE